MAKSKNKVATVVKKTARKAKETAIKTATKVAKNPDLSINVVLGLGGIVVGYFLIKTLVNVGQTLSGNNVKDNIEVGKKLKVNNSKTTISKSQARSLASQLLTAFNWEFSRLFLRIQGTDLDTVLSVFKKIKNSDDFKLIYKEFGKKHYNGFGSPDTFGGVQDLVGFAVERDLVFWLKEEISSRDGETYRLVKKRVEEAGFIF